MADTSNVEPTPPAIADLAKSIVAQALTPSNLEKLRKNAQNAAIETVKEHSELAAEGSTWLAELFTSAILGALNAPGPLYNGLANVATKSLLGEGGSGFPTREDAGVKLIARVAGNPGQIVPGTENAERYLTMLMHEQVEAWVRGIVVELATELLPRIMPLGGGLETFAKLEDIVSNMLGDGRLVRRILMPFINATTITPAQWHVNKQYRPELLSAAAAIEAMLAGRYNVELLHEELARQGWSTERINVLIENAKKRLSFSDLVELWHRGGVDRTVVIARAGQLGYDAETADELLTLAEHKRRDRYKDSALDAATAAFIARDIDEAEYRKYVQSLTPALGDVPLIVSCARTRRDLRVSSLTSGEARRLAEKRILSVIDYRRALQREGRDPEAITALELELIMELERIDDAAEARRRLEEQRQKEREERERERREREAELAARRALPSLQEYRRAYVRGHISQGTFQAAIEREKTGVSADDLALLLADAEGDRNAYLEQRAERDRIAARRHDQTLPIADFEDAVMRGLFTLAEFDARLAERKLPDDERRLLVSILQDRLDDREEAEQRRREAEARARERNVDLAGFARAVRLGLRTRAQYHDLLLTLDTPDVQIALVLDLLDRQIADDNAARARREQAEREEAERRRKAEEARTAAERERLLKEAQRAIPLTLRRRAVVAGVKPRDYYAESLIAAGWKAEDQITELALLDLEIQQAAEERERRRQIEAETKRRREEEEERRRQREAELERRRAQADVPVTNYRRAVLAGLMPLNEYGFALQRAGWTDEERDVEIRLVTREVADLAEAEQRRLRIEQDIAARREQQRLREEERERLRALPPPPPELTLGQMERAVILGIAPPDELRAWLLDRAYDPDDVELVVALAVARIPNVREAERVEARVEQDLAAQRIQLADLKRAVKRGIRTLDEYAADLTARNIAGDDVELLRQLLDEEIALDLDGLRKKVEDTLAKTDGAPALDAVIEAFASGELDVAGVRDVLVMSGVARDAALVFARLLDAYGVEG